MHHQVTLIVAQQQIADLRRAADHDRLAQAATTASRSDAPTAGRPVAAAPVTLIRRLRRMLKGVAGTGDHWRVLLSGKISRRKRLPT